LSLAAAVVAGAGLAALPAVAAVGGHPGVEQPASVLDSVGSAPASPVPVGPSASPPPAPDPPTVPTKFVFADAGNYILYDAEPAIRAAFGDGMSSLFSTHTIGGFGLSQYTDLWRSVLGTDVPSNSPAVVVMMMGNADFEMARADPQWYRELLDESVAMMSARGAKILWLGLPPLPANVQDEIDRQNVNRMYADLQDRWPGVVRYVSTDDVLGFHGIWVRSMPDDPDHRPIRKVKEDGSPDQHVCPEGAARVAQLVHDEIQAMVGNAPAEPWDWENGNWRWDPRYDDPIGACWDSRPTVRGAIP
jgi:hypothetical protein